MRMIFKVLPAILSVILSLSMVLIPVPIAAQMEQPPEITQAQIISSEADVLNPDNLTLDSIYPQKGNPKLDSALNGIVDNPASALPASAAGPNNLTDEPTVRVIVESLPGGENETLAAASGLGIVETEYNGLLQVNLPVSGLSELAANDKVKFVRQPYLAQPDSVVSEGVSLINASAWQNAGYRGSGVKIGILDGGFAGYTNLQNQGELPANITTWWGPSLGGPGTSNHGAACAEIVYDIAPDAVYYLANFDTEVEFGNAVDWLIAQHVDIISCSMGFLGAGPGDGTGPIDQIVDRAYNAGILWSGAAGNQAQRHWSGTFVNSDGDDWLNFAPGDEGNTISVTAGTTITAILNWNDAWGSSSNDYDLVLFDKNNDLAAYSENEQNGNDDPFEGFSYTSKYDGDYFLAIARYGNPSNRTFNLFTYNQNLQYQVISGSISVPADSTHVMTVGAVPWNAASTIESFSSQGPNTAGMTKPDVVAPDRVSTVTYGTTGFGGTSAAAPGAAGAAAIIKQVNPGFTLAQLRAYMENHVVDLGTAGKDNIFGSGRLILGNPPGKLAFTTPAQNLTAGTASGLITVQSQDSLGNALNVTANTVITLSSNSTAGRFDISAGGSFSGATINITITAGTNSTGFYYKDTLRGTPIITAAGSGLATASQPQIISAGPAARIRVETAADGSGGVVAAQNLASGSSLTVFGVTRDQYNNYVGNPPGTTWSLVNIYEGIAISDLNTTSGPATTLTGHLVGMANIHCSNGSLPATDSGYITVIKSALDHLQINTQPASTLSVDSAFSTAAVVQACDIGNNPLSNISIIADRDPATGGGSLVAGQTVITDANGMAAFTNLQYNKTDIFKVRFSSGGKSLISNPVGPLSAGAAAAITIATPPATGPSVDDNFTVQPVILVTDKYANPKNGVAVTASRGAGTGALRGNLTATSDINGLAAFAGLGYSKSAETFKIHFAAGSISIDSAALGPLAPGAAKSISLASAPAAGLSTDDNLTIQPVIRVVDQFANFKDNVSVSVSIGTGSGTLRGNLSATSNASGLAAFSGLGYSKSGEAFTLHFTAGSLTADSAVLGPLAPGAAKTISIASAPAIGASVDVILATQPAILVLDQFANPKNGIIVTAARGAGTGSLRGTLTATSGINGQAAFSGLGYSKSGEAFSLHFTVNSSIAVDSASLGPLAPGAAKTISILTAPAANGSVDDNLTTQPVIRVVDQYANVKDNISVSASIGTGTGILRGTLTATSNASGLAAFSGLGYSKSGEAFTLHFAAGSLTADSASIGPLAPGAATQIRVETTANGSGTLVSPQVLIAGNSLTVYAVTRDQFNNFAANPSDAAWTLINSTGNVSNSDLSAALGASVKLNANKAGTTVIHCTKAALTSVDSGVITVNMGPPTSLTIATVPAIGASVDDNLTIQPVILVVDKGNNPLAGIMVTASKGAGTGALRGTLTATSDINGLASFAGLGYSKSAETFTIHFTAESLNVDSASLGPLAPGAAKTISLATTPAAGLSTDDNLTTQPVIRVVDQFANFKDNVNVSVSIGTGTGILRGNLSATSNASGLAAFSGLGYSKSGEAFTLHFTAGSLTADSAGLGPLAPGAAKTISIASAPAIGASVDVILAAQPAILVLDQFANPKNGIIVTATKGTTDNGTLMGTLTATSNASGLAAFTNLGYTLSGKTFTLHFAAGSLTVDSASLGPLSPGAAKTISILTAPAANGSVDDNLTTQPAIRVMDQYANFKDNVSVTASIGTGSGILRGSLTAASDNSGLAAFNGLGYSKSGETFTLHFTAGNLTIDSASLGPLSPGAATQIRVESAASGSGKLIGPQALLINDNLTVYGITRDQFSNYVGRPNDTTWSLDNTTTVARILSAGTGDNATLTGLSYGTVAIHAANPAFNPAVSGLIYVNPLPPVLLTVSVAPAAGSSVDDDLITQPVIRVTDNETHPIGGIWVTASRGTGSGTLRGTLTAVSDASGMAAFTDLGYNKSLDNFTIHFLAEKLTCESALLGPLSSGAASCLNEESAANGNGSKVLAQNVTVGSTLTLYGIVRDRFGNFVGNNPALWSLVDKTGGIQDNDLVTSPDNLTAIFTAHQIGTAYIEALASGLAAADSGLITVVAAQSSGGGGGGGGSSTPPLTSISLSGLVSSATLKTNTSGSIQSAGQLKTADGQVTLDIPNGAKLLNSNNSVLTSLSAAFLATPPAPAVGRSIILAYTLGPEGAKFDPAITLSLSFDPAQLPANVNEQDLYIAYYDGAQWQQLEGTLNSTTHKISANITHFSVYGLLGKISEPVVTPPTLTTTPAPVIVPTNTPAIIPTLTAIPFVASTPAATPTPLLQVTPAEILPAATSTPADITPGKSFNWTLVIAIVGVLLVIAVVLMIMRRPKTKGKS